jgi:hypothetical protein
MALLGGTMLCVACKKDEPKSTACEIVSFSVNGEAWSISGTNITHAYPAETAATSLTPTITLSPGATVNPPSGTAQNFFTPEGVTYTVTAEDGVAMKTYVAKATVQASGVTGDCTWTLTGTACNYTLTISGNGAMGYYDNRDNLPPWDQYSDDIKTAVVQDGVTVIGDYAFYYCIRLAPVTIPNSVTTIGEYTFYNCRSLTSVIIPNSVKTIGHGAFTGCSGLTSVTIPNSVTSIVGSAFQLCSGLTSINTDLANTQYSSENGVLFNKDKTTIVCYPGGKTGSYVIPNSVIIIGDYAFHFCRGLSSVTIPNSVTTIGNSAFRYCDGLTTVTIPNSVTTIVYQAFEYCSGLTSVTIPNSVTTIYDRAFYGCVGLTSVTIGNSVTTIGDGAFDYCDGLTAIHVDAANTQYSSENGVLFNKDKTTLVIYPRGKTGSYVIPNSVTTIGKLAFMGCVGLTSVTIPNSAITIGDMAFGYCLRLTDVTIGNLVTTIGNYAFENCSNLTSVTIGHSVTTIGFAAFDDCSSLTTVTNLRPAPQNIGSDVFANVNIGACTLEVPASAVNDYKAAPVWSEFGNIEGI